LKKTITLISSNTKTHGRLKICTPLRLTASVLQSSTTTQWIFIY